MAIRIHYRYYFISETKVAKKLIVEGPKVIKVHALLIVDSPGNTKG